MKKTSEAPVLMLDIKTKYVVSILLVIIGVAATYFGINYLILSWWWLVAIFFGLGFIYIYGEALLFPKRLLLLISGNYLYVHFGTQKAIEKNKNKLTTEGVYKDKLALDKITNIWKYTFNLNHATVKEVIYIRYEGVKKLLIDLGESESNLTQNQFKQILNFMTLNLPNVIIGK